jgi:YD repeat-containing protein
VAVQDPVGNRWAFTYDPMGRRVTVDDPDSGTATTRYNDAGDAVATVDARGATLVSTYDQIGRRTGLYDGVVSGATVTAGAKRATWVYDTLTDAKGYLASASRWVDGNEYKVRIRGYTALYQPKGEDYVIPLAEEGLDGTYTFTRSYAPDGSPEKLGLPGVGGLGAETLTTTYDATTGLPEQLQTNWPGAGQYVTDTDYTAFGEVGFTQLQQTGGSWVQRASVFDDATHRLSQATTIRQTAAQFVTDLHYGYDATGNIRRIADTPKGGAADVQCFRYDHLRRLTDAWTPSSGECGAARRGGHDHHVHLPGAGHAGGTRREGGLRAG